MESTTFPIDMLEYLVCPETHQKLELAGEDVVAKLQARQKAGELKNRGGQPVSEAFQQLLIREDRQFAYLITDGFPIMLIDEAVALD